MRRWVAIGTVLAVVLVTGCSSTSSDVSSSRSDRSDGSAAETNPPGPRLEPGSVTPPDVPVPPEPVAVADGDPAAQAAALALATAPNTEGAESAWLAAYDMARIPVLGPTGSALGTTGDDPLGPSWWEVWMVSGAQPNQGMPLPDVLKIAISPEGAAASDEQAAAATEAFIADLAAGLASGDPAAVFTVSFLDAKARQAGTPVSLLDPNLDVASTTIDTATAHLLVWVALRTEAATIPVEGPAIAGLRSRAAAPAPPKACSQLWGSDQATWVTNWLVNKISSGVTLPGLQVKGLLEKVAELNPHIISGDAFTKFNKFASRVNALTSVASMVMQYAALDVGASAESLDRTRTTTDGATTTVRFDILLNPERMPDGNSKALCALSFVLNGLGVSFNFPAAGFLAGVSVTLTGGDGFGTRVLFANFEQMKQDSDANGSVFVTILGKGQAKEIPESAPRIDAEYTIEIEATPEPVDGNSLFNAMFDALTFAASPNPLSALALVLDIMKTAHWDLPDQIFPMLDWQGLSYVASGGAAEVSISGTIPDLTSAFTLDAVFTGGTAVFSYTPSGDRSGTYTVSGSGSGATLTGGGSYTIADNGDGTLTMTQTTTACVDVSGRCNTVTEVLTLTPA